MTSSKVVAFLVGFLVAMILSRSGAVEAASGLMFGSYNNAAKAITVTSTGAVNVQLN